MHRALNILDLGTLTNPAQGGEVGEGEVWRSRRIRVVPDYIATSRLLWATTGPVSKRTVVHECWCSWDQTLLPGLQPWCSLQAKESGVLCPD